MANVKAIVFEPTRNGSACSFSVSFFDTDNGDFNFDNTDLYLDFGVELIHGVTTKQIYDTINTKIATYATNNSYTLASNDIYWPALSPNDVDVFQTPSYNYTPGRSIVTGTGATGFQVSSTRRSFVTYSSKIVTTATIAGGQEGYVVLEIASTNSATAGDWKEVGRVTNGQALSLALTLQSIQPVSAPMSAYVPAGYYVKIRSVNVTGTPAYTMVSGQEVLL